MKNPASYIFLLFFIISCQDDVKFNNPAFEGQKDNVFWRAVDSKATLSGGSLTIEGFTSTEKVSLKTNSTILGPYPLGTGIENTATYVLTDANGSITFSTGNGKGNGEIIIEKYENNTITGTFKFNAVNVNNIPPDKPTINFHYGHFYKVPVTNL